MCVQERSLQFGKLTPSHRWCFFPLRRNFSRRAIRGSRTRLITLSQILHSLLTGDTHLVCVNELPSRRSRFPSRTRGCGARGPQPRPARPMGCSSVGATKHRIVWWRSLQGMSTGQRPPVAGIINHNRSQSLDRAQEQCLRPITT